MERKTLISITSPCFNEEGNIEELYRRVVKAMEALPKYDFEYVFIDNASTDRTVDILRGIASKDSRVKVILNTRNFGHIRSPYWGIINTKGDATIYLASDLQDPPELILNFIEEWRAGYKIVLATKPVSQTGRFIHFMRKIYYKFLNLISEVNIVKDATGFGLYDKKVLDQIRIINDPYPFLRGLICNLGYEIKIIPFNQPRRLKGISKNNFYSLFDIGMLGLISDTKLPLRISSFIGFIISITCLIIGFIYLIFKLVYWESFSAGIAPLIVSIFFLFGLLFGILGIVGEYILVIYTHVNNRPIIVEKERINF